MEESKDNLLGAGKLSVLALFTALISCFGLPLLKAVSRKIGIGENVGFWTTRCRHDYKMTIKSLEKWWNIKSTQIITAIYCILTIGTTQYIDVCTEQQGYR